MKITSTEDKNKAFKEKDNKFREWATQDTLEKKVAKAVMGVPHNSAKSQFRDV